MRVVLSLIVPCLAALLLSGTQAQTGRCQKGAQYACVGRSKLAECVLNKYNITVASREHTTCATFMNTTDRVLVCYGGSSKMEKVCGDPPPPCTTSGNFRVKGRCNNFYTCVSIGSTHLQYIIECEPGFEFSERDDKCVNTSVAGCSVPYPITATTTTDTPTPSTTTIPLPCPALSRIADPDSCQNYYQCMMFGRVLRRCSGNLRFDVATLSCRANAECGARPLTPPLKVASSVRGEVTISAAINESRMHRPLQY